MGNTVCFYLQVCRGTGMGMALPYPHNTVPLPTGLWILTTSHVPDHMMLLITTTSTAMMTMTMTMTPSLAPNASGGAVLFFWAMTTTTTPLSCSKCKWGGFFSSGQQWQQQPPLSLQTWVGGSFVLGNNNDNNPLPHIKHEWGGFLFFWATTMMTPSLTSNLSGGVFFFSGQWQ